MEVTRDYQKLRDAMVDDQLIPRGIRDQSVLAAMRSVPRHLFVPSFAEHAAYADCPLPIGEGQTISQPYMVAVMTELLELSGNEKVLEIGTGSGYQAALLSVLSKEVYTIERIASLAERAAETLRELRYDNVMVKTGDGSIGLAGHAPFDRIITTAASPKVPPQLIGQLAPQGILVIPVGSRYSQVLVKLRKTRAGLLEEVSTPCVFVPLIGEEGWTEGD